MALNDSKKCEICSYLDNCSYYECISPEDDFYNNLYLNEDERMRLYNNNSNSNINRKSNSFERHSKQLKFTSVNKENNILNDIEDLIDQHINNEGLHNNIPNTDDINTQRSNNNIPISIQSNIPIHHNSQINIQQIQDNIQHNPIQNNIMLDNSKLGMHIQEHELHIHDKPDTNTNNNNNSHNIKVNKDGFFISDHLNIFKLKINHLLDELYNLGQIHNTAKLIQKKFIKIFIKHKLKNEHKLNNTNMMRFKNAQTKNVINDIELLNSKFLDICEKFETKLEGEKDQDIEMQYVTALLQDYNEIFKLGNKIYSSNERLIKLIMNNYTEEKLFLIIHNKEEIGNQKTTNEIEIKFETLDIINNHTNNNTTETGTNNLIEDQSHTQVVKDITNFLKPSLDIYKGEIKFLSDKINKLEEEQKKYKFIMRENNSELSKLIPRVKEQLVHNSHEEKEKEKTNQKKDENKTHIVNLITVNQTHLDSVNDKGDTDHIIKNLVSSPLPINTINNSPHNTPSFSFNLTNHKEDSSENLNLRHDKLKKNNLSVLRIRHKILLHPGDKQSNIKNKNFESSSEDTLTKLDEHIHVDDKAVDSSSSKYKDNRSTHDLAKKEEKTNNISNSSQKKKKHHKKRHASLKKFKKLLQKHNY